MKDNVTLNDPTVSWICRDEVCRGKGTYTVSVKCTNCDWSGRAEMTRSHEFSPYSVRCPSCECNSLMRICR